jgi:ubiquinone/menaquinone biosynthesis C-methylase UbiE
VSVARFEDRAADWIRFARAEGHDAYWAYRDAFFELLPPPPARALEIGCGEGRVARDLRAHGYEVTGLDVAPTLVEAACDADPSGTYVVGDAAALPFDDASFDLVVSYNSLIDVDDMPAAVAEAGRVLWSGGCFCACVPHPFSEAGEFEGGADDAPFVVAGSYLAEAD